MEYLKEKRPYFEYDELIYKGLNENRKGELIEIAIKGLKKFYNVEISTKYLKQFLPTLKDFNKMRELKGKSLLTQKEFNSKMSLKIRNVIRPFNKEHKYKFYHEDTWIKTKKDVLIYDYDKNNKVYVKDVKSIGVGKEIHKKLIPECLTLLR